MVCGRIAILSLIWGLNTVTVSFIPDSIIGTNIGVEIFLVNNGLESGTGVKNLNT